MIWGDEAKSISGTTKWTETAEPLPCPPLAEFENAAAISTITNNPCLFRVSTPINIDRFETLLSLANHPNPPFVHSVCQGLREGFWPWADTQVGVYPTTWDIPSPSPSSELERNFIWDQIAKEELVGRYSSNFGPDLLPGMYSMPIHAVPKEGGKFRLVTNHSTSDFSLNSMIAKEDITGVTLDNVQDLGDAIREYRRHDPNNVLHIWKADVSEAYCHMPMHPLWQIKQVVSFEGEQRVDHANVFGGHASQCIFHAFMSLVIWIAVFICLIQAFIYVNDSFSFAKIGDMSYYVKYRKMLPTDMVTLLLLWDELGIPHEEQKQIFGSPLPIIGFNVDPNLMKISLKEESKRGLVHELHMFAKHKQKRSLRDFEHIAGSLNWALNVCPLLHPGLSALYAKIKGKTNSKGMLWMNRSIVDELLWAVFHLERSNGIYLLKSVSWQFEPLSLDVLKVFCDASGSGMGFWYPSLLLGFQSNLPERSPVHNIFFFEALCVTSTIHDAVTRLLKNGRLAVYTDSLNTVYMFNSLSGGVGYNHLLMDVVKVILAFNVDFRVFHISGEDNVVADHLSRWQARDALCCSPSL
ncbi:DNA/RNA polymerase [Suillus weaverae]|nr:DNA/RNA polymerase [Suillus weaverae]